MTLCPITIAVGHQKCPALGICPLENVIWNKPVATVGQATELEPKSKK